MDKIKKLFEKDQYAKLSGIETLEINPGQAKCKMLIRDIHRNGLGMTHGGALFTLADFTFSIAANSHGRYCVSLNATISYVKAAINGTLFAEAKELSLNNKVGTYDVKITDEKNELIATFTGLAYRKKEEI